MRAQPSREFCVIHQQLIRNLTDQIVIGRAWLGTWDLEELAVQLHQDKNHIIILDQFSISYYMMNIGIGSKYLFFMQQFCDHTKNTIVKMFQTNS